MSKSTGIAHLSASLAAMRRASAPEADERPILIVDLDSQAHAGIHLGVPPGTRPSIAEVIYDGLRVRDAIRETNVPGVHILPGAREMRDYSLSIATLPDREQIIARMLAPVRDEYALTCIDCPPGAGLVHPSVYALDDCYIVCPAEPDASAFDGVLEVQADLAEARDVVGNAPDLLGVLLSKVDLRTREHRDNVQEAREVLGPLMLGSTIRLTTRMREAWREGVLIHNHAPRSGAAADYDSAAREIWARLQEVAR